MIFVDFRKIAGRCENWFSGTVFRQQPIVHNYHNQPLAAADGVCKNGAEIGKRAVVFNDIGFGGNEGFVFPTLDSSSPEDLDFGGHYAFLVLSEIGLFAIGLRAVADFRPRLADLYTLAIFLLFFAFGYGMFLAACPVQTGSIYAVSGFCED